MALDSDNVRVAVSGAVYVAPTGTTAPTTSGSTLDAAFVDLGYVSSDGVTENIDRSTTQIRAWQNGSLVREVTQEGTYSVSMTFIETNEAVLELYYGTAMMLVSLQLTQPQLEAVRALLLMLWMGMPLSASTSQRVKLLL